MEDVTVKWGHQAFQLPSASPSSLSRPSLPLFTEVVPSTPDCIAKSLPMICISGVLFIWVPQDHLNHHRSASEECSLHQLIITLH
ncbi:rCG44137 [Rattus norvegicus]|uniref:RCG44137 n=1 Tax=Rattus norvegicus TaxID=10116 RepID=A6J758_RAT|nr:rCG44137 [Rattus norvegicus]